MREDIEIDCDEDSKRVTHRAKKRLTEPKRIKERNRSIERGRD